nr:ww domain-containing protein c2f3.14c [Quercus suber]
MEAADDFKIKGAASLDAQEQASEPVVEQQAADLKTYPWYKIYDEQSQVHYFMSVNGQESQWTEPGEPYWIWNNAIQGADLEAGLQQPSKEQGEEYKGYNPKIHGDYDPTAPYARHHEEQREREHAEEQARHGIVPATQQYGDYVMTGAFNARTGRFQTGEQSAERHNDYNKSGRQMDAYGHNIDAAANSHGGVSLKEERRNHKISKKELTAIREKKKQRKRAKEMAFYTS